MRASAAISAQRPGNRRGSCIEFAVSRAWIKTCKARTAGHLLRLRERACPSLGGVVEIRPFRSSSPCSAGHSLHPPKRKREVRCRMPSQGSRQVSMAWTGVVAGWRCR